MRHLFATLALFATLTGGNAHAQQPIPLPAMETVEAPLVRDLHLNMLSLAWGCGRAVNDWSRICVSPETTQHGTRVLVQMGMEVHNGRLFLRSGPQLIPVKNSRGEDVRVLSASPSTLEVASGGDGYGSDVVTHATGVLEPGANGFSRFLMRMLNGDVQRFYPQSNALGPWPSR